MYRMPRWNCQSLLFARDVAVGFVLLFITAMPVSLWGDVWANYGKDKTVNHHGIELSSDFPGGAARYPVASVGGGARSGAAT